MTITDSHHCCMLLLQATIEMCKILDKTEHIEHFQDLLNRAAQAYDEKLWNGKLSNISNDFIG